MDIKTGQTTPIVPLPKEPPSPQPMASQPTEKPVSVPLSQPTETYSKPTQNGEALSAVSFLDEPKPIPQPKSDHFPGYFSLAQRDPVSQPLQGVKPGTWSPVQSDGSLMGFDAMVQKVDSPEEVTKMLQPFGSEVYDYDRADNNKGPFGSQSPEYTHNNRAGICRDSHFLGAYVLQEHGYNARQTGYYEQDVAHAVLTYEGKKGEGFGLIEYGTHYSPEQIEKVLGRPALSHEEALMAVRPGAKNIRGYSDPKRNEEGHIKSIHYTLGQQLYNNTLKVGHTSRLEYNSQEGLVLEARLNDYWGIKAGVNTGQSPDPTARNSVFATVGYQRGDQDNFFKMSTGIQYRPNEGHSSIGSNTWNPAKALVLGARVEGQWTPFKVKLSENFQTRTTVSGEVTGALALSKADDTDWEMDNGLMSGLTFARARVGQHIEGQLNENWSVHSELFMDNDLYLAGMAYTTGGKGVYANIGANASLQYQKDGLTVDLGAQKLIHQVNNLEATGGHLGVSYASGRFEVGGGVNYLESPEGERLQTEQRISYKLAPNWEAYGNSQQEQIFNETHGRFSNPGGQKFGLGITGRF